MEQISQFKQPLTAGEFCLLEYLENNLKKDPDFNGGNLAEYNGWLIFVQPFLNGSRPDIIIFNPRVGVQIFEVKDWDLRHYSFENRKGNDSKIHKVFCVSDRNGTYQIKSPIKQVEHYKEKICGQLIPRIGEDVDEKTKTYGLIKTAVYFHKTTTESAQTLFKETENNFKVSPVIGYDALKDNNLIAVVPDIRWETGSLYWKKEWNDELLFWLNPPVHMIEQGTLLTLTTEQRKFANPQVGHQRVRGVAGSGKTQVLAYRAAKLASEGKRVLVLTFNITLWHYIHDMINRSPFKFNWTNITATHFHGFCKDTLNEFGENWPQEEGNGESVFKDIIVKKVLETIKKQDYFDKYDAILIDEGQDFYVEWYHMLCEFLTDRDELVVVCDKKQNIYGRELEWLDKRRSNVDKFGEWIELRTIMRLPEHVATLCEDFSAHFNLNQDVKRKTLLPQEKLFNQLNDQVIWWNTEEKDWLEKTEEAYELIKNKAYNRHPSDTVILLPNKDFGIVCVKHFDSKKDIKTCHVFEDDDEQKYHRHKKAFWIGDSRLKMSTIQSFKGWEAPNVIVFIPSGVRGSKSLYDNLIYTAITRTRQNLIIINSNSRYKEFGSKYSDNWK
jgi:hypothetical protein